jgi:hypothetical protein
MKILLEQWKRYLTLTENREVSWQGFPEIGWWEKNDPLTLYHGTHVDNITGILENGIYAPKEGYTAGKVSLALEPNTAFGYASMRGGETNFRNQGKQAEHVPPEDRVVFILQLPQSIIRENMLAGRYNMDDYKNKLIDPKLYEGWKLKHGGDSYDYSKFDQEYYALTEIRLPEHVSEKYIVGYMKK